MLTTYRSGGGGGITSQLTAVPEFYKSDPIKDGEAITGYKLIVNPDKEADLIKFLDKELKISFLQKREEAIALAAEKPSKWLAQRNLRMEEVKKRVATAYALELGKFDTAGFPPAESMARASKFANLILMNELENLELTYPGSSTVFNSAAHIAANRNDNFNLATGGAEVDKKAIYKEMRALKKAKRAKKLSKA